ncbi:hypothetical protein PDE_04606 [Penicillium oxalicum 114-2]|uniref:Uncharacterized protein n=1 Tax=Penicillium oxalicum (strain 114-2 / CGMCC 5302) TaxID=933388 RepID=S7ZLT6_PENO1|nr:hypothetical protein PDE_04606 [Penicillium oxalicum 114-2]
MTIPASPTVSESNSASASCQVSGEDARDRDPADEAMRQAIDRFRVKMATANENFLKDRIDEIERKGLATEQEKFKYLVHHYRYPNIAWEDANTSPRQGSVLIPANTLFKDLDISTIEKGLRIDEAIDGVLLPPLLQTKQRQQVFLDTLQRLCQFQSDNHDNCFNPNCREHEEEESIIIPPCTELALFLTHARGVVDNDYRFSYIPHFIPGDWYVRVSDGSQDPDEEARCLRDNLEEYLKEQYLCHPVKHDVEAFQYLANVLAPDDLEIRAGFATGVSYRAEAGHEMWCSGYVYCRKDVNYLPHPEEDQSIPDAANITEWGWRVIIYSADLMLANPPAPAAPVINGRKARWDSIPEFLDWYASWQDDLDERKVRTFRRFNEDHHIDCDSNCGSDDCYWTGTDSPLNDFY